MSKVKVSISLTLQLYAQIERMRAQSESRSEVYERLLRRGLEAELKHELGVQHIEREIRTLRVRLERAALRSIATYLLLFRAVAEADGQEAAQRLAEKLMKVARETLYRETLYKEVKHEREKNDAG